MQENKADRETRLRELASKLFLLSKVRARGSRCPEMSICLSSFGVTASRSTR
jgi:hypothetical protein